MAECSPSQVKNAAGDCVDLVSAGRRRRHSRRRTMRVSKGTHVKAKTLKRMLKKAGLKVSGKKSTLRSRARKAHLIRGGYAGLPSSPASVGV